MAMERNPRWFYFQGTPGTSASWCEGSAFLDGTANPRMSRIRFLARLRVPKHPTFEFAFGLEPIVQLTAWL